MVLTTDEYDAAYFGDSSTDLRHKAGYSDYAEINIHPFVETNFKRVLSGNNFTGGNNSVLELGCGYGEKRKYGLNIPGITTWDMIDVSPFAFSKARDEDKPFFTVADARTYVAGLADRAYDHIISFRLLPCFTDAQVTSLVTEMNRVSKKRHIHALDTFDKKINTKYYNGKTLLEWKNSFPWKRGTILVEYKSPNFVIVT